MAARLGETSCINLYVRTPSSGDRVLEDIDTLTRVVELVELMVGFLLAFKAGRKLARYRHDMALVKRYGHRLPGGVGVVFYLLIAASMLVNLAILLSVKLVTSLLKLGIALVTGRYDVFAVGLGVTAAGVVTGYILFTLRYRGVGEPLTREGRLVWKGVRATAKMAETLGMVKKVAELGASMLPKPLSPPRLDDVLKRVKGGESDKTSKRREEG